MLGFVTRRRYEADLAAARAETDRLRERAEKAEGIARTEVNARRTVVAQNAGLDADNRRLADRNLELGRRVSTLAEADPEYTASLERRVARLLRVGKRIVAAYALEQHRADGLQKRLDDCLGLNTSQITDGRLWQHTRHDKKGVAS